MWRGNQAGAHIEGESILLKLVGPSSQALARFYDCDRVTGSLQADGCC